MELGVEDMKNYGRVMEVGTDVESQERREANRERSADILKHHNIQFSSNNSGAHLVVTWGEKLIDFWPGTGKFIVRDEAKHRRGVFNLLLLLGIEHDKEI